MNQNTDRHYNSIAYLKSKLVSVAFTKLLPFIFLFIITILYANKLTKYEYGQFQSIWVYSNILCVVLNFGFSSTLLSSNFDEFMSFIKKNKTFISFSYFFLLVIAACGLLYSSGLNRNITMLLLLYITFQVIGMLYDALLIKLDRLKIYTGINLFYSILFFGVHLFFYCYSYSLRNLIFSLALVSFIKLITFSFLKIRVNYSETNFSNIIISKNWLFIASATIIGILSMWLDKLYLQLKMPPDQFAVFFNGAIEVPFFGIIIGAVETILLRGISVSLHNKKDVVNLFKESIKLISAVAFPVFCFFLVFHFETFSLIFQNKYNESVPIFFIYIFLIPLRVTHFGVILQCYGKAHIVTLGAFGDGVLSLFLMFVLYPRFGTQGVAFALVFSTYLQALFYLYKSSQLLKVGVPDLLPVNHLLKVLLFNGTLFTIFLILKKCIPTYHSFFASLSLMCSVIIFFIYRYWSSTKKINP